MQNKVSGGIWVYAAALVAMFFWGMSFIWTSIVFEYYSPIATIFLRLVISCIFLFGILFLSGKFRKIKKEHYWLLLASAAFNPFLYFLGENYGLKHSSASITAIIIATIPVVSPLAAWLIIKERLSWLNLTGIIVSFGGILILIINPDLSFAADPVGIMYLSGAVLSAVIYSVLVKKLTENYSPINIIAWQNLIGVLFFLPLFILYDIQNVLSVIPDERLLYALFSLAIFASSLAFVFFTFTIKHLGVSRANVYGNLIPIITVIASYYILGELISEKNIAAMVVVIAGVIITQIKKIKYKHE